MLCSQMNRKRNNKNDPVSQPQKMTYVKILIKKKELSVHFKAASIV